jgi:hypothetical protein
VARPCSSVSKNGQLFGSLQQAPQCLHSPLRFLSTGKMLVAVRLSLADRVFFEKGFVSVPCINMQLKVAIFRNYAIKW